MDFENSVALVTGGANGLGRATATRLAEAGAKVVVADIETGPGEEVAALVGGEFIVLREIHARQDETGLDHIGRIAGVPVCPYRHEKGLDRFPFVA